MKVKNFIFCKDVGAMLPGYAKFTAEFSHWSKEQSITVCKCSHGKMVRIPDFALEGFNKEDYPPQEL